jgi:hypothetical protein
MVECDAGADPIANADCLVQNFSEVALNDPVAAVLLTVGAVLVVVPSAVFGGLAAGGLLSGTADLL